MYDNDSTDDTPNIAYRNSCKIIPYHTNNEVNDELLTGIKNNCWKNANTDWVLVCDPDELFDVNENDLKFEENRGTTIIKATGYNMVNMNDDFDIQNMKYGVRSPAHDKCFIFNKKYISDINFNHGSHFANPQGTIKYNEKTYPMYHYHFVNIDYMFNRYQMTIKRFSEINKKHGWGIHCNKSKEELRTRFDDLRKQAVKIRQ
jgi:glycosyltransferase involved in cell wall biosynthesis